MDGQHVAFPTHVGMQHLVPDFANQHRADMLFVQQQTAHLLESPASALQTSSPVLYAGCDSSRSLPPRLNFRSAEPRPPSCKVFTL